MQAGVDNVGLDKRSMDNADINNAVMDTAGINKAGKENSRFRMIPKDLEFNEKNEKYLVLQISY